MMFSYKHEALLNTWTSSNLRYCYEARRVMRWMQISLKSLTFQSFGVKIHTLCNLCFHPKGFEQFQHHLLIHLKLPSILLHTQDLGSLSPWKGKNLANKIALSPGSFSNDNSDSNKSVKTVIGLLRKQTSLHMLFCTFVCHCGTTTMWKCLISHFMEDVNKRWGNFLFPNLRVVPKKSSPGKVAYIRHFQWIIWNKHDEVWKTLIHFKSDVFIVVAVVDARTPYLIKPAVAGTQATLGFKSHKIGKQAVREDKP